MSGEILDQSKDPRNGEAIVTFHDVVRKYANQLRETKILMYWLGFIKRTTSQNKLVERVMWVTERYICVGECNKKTGLINFKRAMPLSAIISITDGSTGTDVVFHLDHSAPQPPSYSDNGPDLQITVVDATAPTVELVKLIKRLHAFAFPDVKRIDRAIKGSTTINLNKPKGWTCVPPRFDTVQCLFKSYELNGSFKEKAAHERELAAQREEGEKKDLELLTMGEKLSKSEDRVIGLSAEVEEKDRLLEKATEEAESCRKKMEDLEQTAIETEARLRESGTQRDIRMEETLRSEREKTWAVERENMQLTEEIRKLQAQLEEVAREKALRAEMEAKHQKELDELASGQQAAQKDFISLKTSLSEKTIELEKARRDHQEDLDRITKDYQAAISDSTAKDSTIHKLRLRQSNPATSELEGQIDEKDKVIKLLEVEVKRLKRELKDAQQQGRQGGRKNNSAEDCGSGGESEELPSRRSGGKPRKKKASQSDEPKRNVPLDQEEERRMLKKAMEAKTEGERKAQKQLRATFREQAGQIEDLRVQFREYDDEIIKYLQSGSSIPLPFAGDGMTERSAGQPKNIPVNGMGAFCSETSPKLIHSPVSLHRSGAGYTHPKVLYRKEGAVPSALVTRGIPL